MSFFARVVADAKTPVTANGAGRENLSGTNVLLGEVAAGETTVPALSEGPHIPMADDLPAMPVIAADIGRQAISDFSPESESAVATSETMSNEDRGNASGGRPRMTDADPVPDGDVMHRKNAFAGDASSSLGTATSFIADAAVGLEKVQMDSGEAPVRDAEVGLEGYHTYMQEASSNPVEEASPQVVSAMDISDSRLEREKDAQPAEDIVGSRVLSQQLFPRKDEEANVSAEVESPLSTGRFLSDKEHVYSEEAHHPVSESATFETGNLLDETSYEMPGRSDEVRNTPRSVDRGKPDKRDVRVDGGHGNEQQGEVPSRSRAEAQLLDGSTRSKKASPESSRQRLVVEALDAEGEALGNGVRHEAGAPSPTAYTRQPHDGIPAKVTRFDSRDASNAMEGVQRSRAKPEHAAKGMPTRDPGRKMAETRIETGKRKPREVHAAVDTPRAKSVPIAAMPVRTANEGARNATASSALLSGKIADTGGRIPERLASRSGNEVHIGQVDVVIEAPRPTAKPVTQPMATSFDSCHYIRGV